MPNSLVDFTEAFERPVGGAGGFGSGVTAFGEDAAGNLYFSELGGRLFKICALGEPELRAAAGASEAAARACARRCAMSSPRRTITRTARCRPETFGPARTMPNFGDTFNANTTNAGNLTIGLEPVGWQGNGADTAPFLFREVPAENLMEVRVRIEQQSAGNWSSAGILVRADGPLDNVTNNDNFLSAHAFRANNNIQVSNVIAGVEAEGNSPAPGRTGLTFLRLVSLGDGEFEVFSSTDGIDWISRTVVTNAALASGLLEVGVWAGCYAGGNTACTTGTARFDWAEIVLRRSGRRLQRRRHDRCRRLRRMARHDWVNQSLRGTAPTATGDGMVDAADYDVWRTNFGRTIPNFSAAGSALPAVVPEPASMTTALACCLALVSQLTILKTRARYTLQHQQAFGTGA